MKKLKHKSDKEPKVDQAAEVFQALENCNVKIENQLKMYTPIPQDQKQ